MAITFRCILVKRAEFRLTFISTPSGILFHSATGFVVEHGAGTL